MTACKGSSGKPFSIYIVSNNQLPRSQVHLQHLNSKCRKGIIIRVGLKIEAKQVLCS